MKTESSRILPTTIVQIVDKQQPQDTMNRKTLQVLQQSAGDKENLVGGGRTARGSTSKDSLQIVKEILDEKKALLHEQLNQKAVAHSSKRQKKMPNVLKGKSKISAEDLTSNDEPSEKYWSILAEKRRVALEATLVENESLHERIKVLEEENLTTKEMLEETSRVIELLTEMVGRTETDESQEGSDLDNDSEDNDGSDSSFESVDITNDSIGA